MQSFLVRCCFCGDNIYRSRGRINESDKFGWYVYCSYECQSKVRNDQSLLICSRQGCSTKFKRLQSDIRKVKKSYCSQSCSAIVNNSNRPRKKRVCSNQNCNIEYCGTNKYCSPQCIRLPKSKYSKDIVVGSIKSFYLERGRLPLKQEMIRIYKPARKHFGSWNNAVKAAGLEPNPVMFARKHIANDGHKCDSLAEKIIDDWFYARRIEHRINVPYPEKNSFTVDFKVGEYWIEYFGLSGEHKRYDELKEKKKELIKKYKISLIEVYPRHLYPNSKLDIKLIDVIN
jgi:hypothetical protein